MRTRERSAPQHHEHLRIRTPKDLHRHARRGSAKLHEPPDLDIRRLVRLQFVRPRSPRPEFHIQSHVIHRSVHRSRPLLLRPTPRVLRQCTLRRDRNPPLKRFLRDKRTTEPERPQMGVQHHLPSRRLLRATSNGHSPGRQPVRSESPGSRRCRHHSLPPDYVRTAPHSTSRYQGRDEQSVGHL